MTSDSLHSRLSPRQRGHDYTCIEEVGCSPEHVAWEASRSSDREAAAQGCTTARGGAAGERGPETAMNAMPLHAELHHQGWIPGRTRWHCFMPGINVSECGAAWCEDDSPRRTKPPRPRDACKRCIRSLARFSMKLMDAGWIR